MLCIIVCGSKWTQKWNTLLKSIFTSLFRCGCVLRDNLNVNFNFMLHNSYKILALFWIIQFDIYI